MSASASPPTPEVEASWEAPYRVDLQAVLGSFVRGRSDPTTRLAADGSAWRTCLTPAGAATLHIVVADRTVRSQAWGPGGPWAVASVPDLLGARDDPGGFPVQALPEALLPAWRRLADGWRVPRSRLVLEALVIAVLEQKVTGIQSRRSWHHLLAEVGGEPPGPAPLGMRILPSADEIRMVPSWQWHRWGVGPHQSATLMRAMRVAGRLQEAADLEPESAVHRLMAVDGIGHWTAAEVAQRALGDPDAVSFGDYHLAKHVVYAFTGGMAGTDDEMADLLAPFAGHRYRVQRIVELSGIARPARGPRMTVADHRRH
jgi:3-methyladenine DNA glycosylase/8-oxoguanine DNA glycosylase